MTIKKLLFYLCIPKRWNVSSLWKDFFLIKNFPFVWVHPWLPAVPKAKCQNDFAGRALGLKRGSLDGFFVAYGRRRKNESWVLSFLRCNLITNFVNLSWIRTEWNENQAFDKICVAYIFLVKNNFYASTPADFCGLLVTGSIRFHCNIMNGD